MINKKIKVHGESLNRPFTREEWRTLFGRSTGLDRIPKRELWMHEYGKLEMTCEYGWATKEECDCCGAKVYVYTVDETQEYPYTGDSTFGVIRNHKMVVSPKD